MDLIYKYTIWRNIFEKCQPGMRYNIQKDRKDYHDFMLALKEFRNNWWTMIVGKDQETDQDWYMLMNPIQAIDEIIDAEKRWSNPTEKLQDTNQASVAKYGDFYTKANNPEELAWQAEQAAKARPVIIPGVCSSTGQHWNNQIDYSLPQEPKSAAQSNDLPPSGTNIPPIQQSSLTEPKNEPNIFEKKLEQLKKEDEDDCEF